MAMDLWLKHGGISTNGLMATTWWYVANSLRQLGAFLQAGPWIQWSNVFSY